MKMNALHKWATLFLLFFLSVNYTVAQEKTKKDTDKDVKVKKRTVMERYEPELVISAEERLQKKKERLAEIKRKRSIIDTLSISNRKRRKLLLELYRSPYSERLSKAIADAEPKKKEKEKE